MLSLPVNSIPMIVAVGGVLGVRHAFEPDHLAAVSTLATRPAARLWSAARLGLVWGLGHTVTVGAVALLIIALGVRLPDRFWPAAELLVAALLVLLGGVVIWRYARGRWHMHTHSHVAASPHFHLHSHASSPDHGHSHTGGDARRSLGDGPARGRCRGECRGRSSCGLERIVELGRAKARRTRRTATLRRVVPSTIYGSRRCVGASSLCMSPP